MQRQPDPLNLLDLLQLADSALPIGAQSHSFGLETLVTDGVLTAANLEAFLHDYVSTVMPLDLLGCRAAHALALENGVGHEVWDEATVQAWLMLNRRLSAFRSAREVRAASAVMGRHFLALVAEVSQQPVLFHALQSAKQAGVECHHAAAFGLASGCLQIDVEAAILAYAQQAVTGLLAAMQKVLPVGQRSIAAIRWNIKPALIAAAAASRDLDWRSAVLPSFAPMLEIASMRHASLNVRLFIS
jgi:urease accessory protein